MARTSSWGLAVVCLSVLIANLMLPMADAVWLTLPSSGTKCVSEEIQNNVVVLADYVVVKEHERPADPNITVSAKDISGTCTSTRKKEELEQKGFSVDLFNASEPEWSAVDSLRSFTHLLVSVPSNVDVGDPILQYEDCW